MNDCRWNLKHLVLALLLVFSSGSIHAKGFQKKGRGKGDRPQKTQAHKTNEALIDLFEGATTRSRDGAVIKGRVFEGTEMLNKLKIPTFQLFTELASASNQKQDVVVQEYLRSQSWGLPWLPLSWTRDHYGNIESEYKDILQKLNDSTKDGNLNDAQLLEYFLFVGTIPHLNNVSLINNMRTAADELGTSDSSFWDLRVEIHQEPSLATIDKVDAYIKRAQSRYKPYAKRIRDQLASLFGNHDIKTFRENYNLPSADREALSAVEKVTRDLHKAKKKKDVENLLDSALVILDEVSELSLEWSEVVRQEPTDCGFGGDINCRYEMFDLLRLYQNVLMSLGMNLMERVGKHEVEISPVDFIQVTRALLVGSAAVGLVDKTTVADIDELVRKNPNYYTIRQLKGYVNRLERILRRTPETVKGVFGPTIRKYQQVVPGADRFVDNTLRASSVLALSNFLGSMYKSLQVMSGVKLEINGNDYATSFRVLNPGIARGVLRKATAEQLTSHDASWDQDSIYILEKTPAQLQLVKGIITADSGSMISHVQLLAGNHGLPNVYVPQGILKQMNSMLGKEVVLTSLPNGEASIQLASNASQEHRQALNEYQMFKEKQKVYLEMPKGLSVNYPLYLEQLRMSDSGVVAGGKACGQGELARLFPDHVPKALVLPFGVYFEHIHKNEIYTFIIEKLSDPALKGNSKKAKAKKKKALAAIRKKIQKIKLNSDVVSAVREFISRPEFEGKGFFVRSDTNAEDLDQFVGAGLNKTVANVRGLDVILDSILEVWSSPFTEKALSWRSDLILNPWDVYPSTIIQVGISSSKAGVMISGDPTAGDSTDAIFIAANEGVGITVVNGEYTPEESIYSRKTGRISRLRKAYADTRKVLTDSGLQEIPALGLDPLVKDFELEALAGIADRFQSHMKTEYGQDKVWDFEFGLVNGRPILFQVRRFIGNKIVRNVTSLSKLESPQSSDSSRLRIGSNSRSLVLEME